MSKNWNADQLVQLSNSLSDAFLLKAARPFGKGQFGKGQPQPRQLGWNIKFNWKVKSLRSFLQLLLQMGQSRWQGGNGWFQTLWVKRSAPASSRQPFSDAWTSDALIRLSEAKASAFFVDFD
jgi:hypothetical protein